MENADVFLESGPENSKRIVGCSPTRGGVVVIHNRQRED
jgi:hypothetical protein